MKTLEDLLANSVDQTSGPDSELERLGLVRTPEVVGDTKDSYFSPGSFTYDIVEAAKNPKAVLKSMGGMLSSQLSGIQEMRADILRDRTTQAELDQMSEAGQAYYKDLQDRAAAKAVELQKSADIWKEVGAEATAEADKMLQPTSTLGQIAKSAVASAPPTLAGFALSSLAGPTAGYSVARTLGSAAAGSSAYRDLKDKGADSDTALLSAARQGLLEWLTERIGLGYFVDMFKAAKVGAKFTPAALKAAGMEAIQEGAAGLTQGLEQAYAENKIHPELYKGVVEYVKSGKIIEDTLHSAIGGLMMGSAFSGITGAIRLSYKPQAILAVKQMDAAIKEAEVAESATINVAGEEIPLETVKQRMSDTIEAYGIKPEEWAETSAAPQSEQEKLGNIVARLKDLIKPVEVPVSEETTVEDVQPTPSVEEQTPVEEIIDLTDEVKERATYQAGSVKVHGQVLSKVADTLNDIYTGLNFQPDVDIFHLDDITQEDLEAIKRDSRTIATIGSGRIITTPGKDGKDKYTIIGEFASKDKQWELSTHLHEAVGHILDYEFYKSAPSAIKSVVEQRFEEWLKSRRPETFMSPDILMQLSSRGYTPEEVMDKISARRPLELDQDYRDRMFREFKAHQISAAMQKRPEVRSVIERYWAKLYAKLQELYKSFKENYLDIATNVGTMDEFVDWLYRSRAPQPSMIEQTVEGSNQVSVENFNTKLNPLVEAVYNSLFEIVDGKRRIKNSWRLNRVFSNGKIGRISKGDLKRTGYSYKEDPKRRVTEVRYGENTVMFTIPWDAERQINRDQARMIAINVRDMLAIGKLKTPASSKKPGRAAQILKRVLEDRAKALASAEGMSVEQAKIIILSQNRGNAPGILGTPNMTGAELVQGQRPYQLIRGRSGIFASLNVEARASGGRTISPAEFQATLQMLQEDIEGETLAPGAADPSMEAIKDEHIEEDRGEQKERATPELDEVENLVASLTEEWYEKVGSFEQVSEKVIFYFEHKGKDYTEVSPTIRNFINATIKDVYQELSGIELQEDIKNKVVQADHVRALRSAGVDTTLEDIELMQMARDMGLASEDDFIVPLDKAIESGIEILGKFKDFADERWKAVIYSGSGNFTSSVGIGKGMLDIPVSWDASDIRLEQVWNDPNLFKLYPELKDLKVEFYTKLKKDGKPSDEAGYSDWFNKTIALNYAHDLDNIKQTLVHEVQHQIQGIEDFAGGASPRHMLKMKRDRRIAFSQASGLLKSLKDIQQRLRSKTLKEVAQDVETLPEGRERNNLEAGIWLVQSEGSVENAIVLQEKEVIQADKDWKAVKDVKSADLYWRTAGEDESRRAGRMYFKTPHQIRVELGQRGVKAFSSLEDKTQRIRTDARSGKVYLSVLSTTEDSANDELLFASFEAMQADDLAVKVKPIKTAKKARVKTRSVRKEGSYAEVLREDLKPRKVRVKKTKSMEQIEAKRQKDAEFLNLMDDLKLYGERKGKSLSEVLQEQGFTPAEIRRSITKFYRMRSKFTQNEMIIRLSEVAGLINEDTGRDGLVGLLQTMFPPITADDGTVIETGSDGTLQGLTAMSKDMVINQLQNIILAKNGSKYDVETEQTLAELRSNFQEEYDKLSSPKKIWSFIKHIQSSASDFLLTTKSGRKLHWQLRRFLLEKTVMQRDYLVQLHDYGVEYSSVEQRDFLYKLLTGEASPRNAKEKHFISLIKRINIVFGKEMQNLGVKVYKKDGTWRYFKYSRDMSENYFPHMWKPEWFRKPTENMIQSILDAGEASDRKHAEIIIKKMGKDMIRVSKFANIEMERETELGGWITDPIEVYTKYIQGSSRRLAAIKVFGENPEVNLAQLSIRHFKDSRDPDSFDKTRKLVNSVLGNRIEDALLKEQKAMTSFGVMVAIGTMLQHALMIQPSILVNMGTLGGYKNLIIGIGKVLPSLWGNKDGRNNRRWAELAGVLAFTVNRELNDIVMEDQHRVKTDKLLRAFGITQVDGFLRIVGAIVGKLHATDVALRYAERKSPRDAKKLRDLGIDPAKITFEYLQTPEWFAHDLRIAALAFVEDSNFVIDPTRAPAILQGSGVFKIFMLFKNFAFQQHRFLMKLIRDREFGKLIGQVLGSTALGSLLLLFRLLAKGEDPKKTLQEDGLVRTIWRAFVTGGGPGLFVEAIGNAATFSKGPVTGMSLDSPAFGFVEQLGKGGKAQFDYFFGDFSQRDQAELYKTYAVGIQALLMSKAVPAQYGIPAAAAIGVARPLGLSIVAPTESQERKSLFR